MTTIEELECLHKAWCYNPPGGELILRAALEIEALQKKLNHEMELNWTASLCDRVNELLREHPVFNEVKDGPACAKAITTIHGYCGSIKCERDSLRSTVVELQQEVERLNSVVAIRDQSRDVLVQLCDSLRSTVAELQKAINESIQDIQRLKSDNGDPVDQLFDKYISRLEKALNTARSAEKK